MAPYPTRQWEACQIGGINDLFEGDLCEQCEQRVETGCGKGGGDDWTKLVANIFSICYECLTNVVGLCPEGGHNLSRMCGKSAEVWVNRVFLHVSCKFVDVRNEEE